MILSLINKLDHFLNSIDFVKLFLNLFFFIKKMICFFIFFVSHYPKISLFLIIILCIIFHKFVWNLIKFSFLWICIFFILCLAFSSPSTVIRF